MQVDDLLNFRQFSKKSADDAINASLVPLLFFFVSSSRQYADDLGKATGAAEVHEDFISNLSRISQLTGERTRWYYVVQCLCLRLSGFSDPIYAEAYVKMHGFDILLGGS